MFMRSQKPQVINRQVAALHEGGMLQYTQSQIRYANDAAEPVPYFIIPSGAVRHAGTMVMSYVNLTRNGFLSLTAPKAYGVIDRPTTSEVEHQQVRLRESHVIAEDMALRRGIYTPYGRAAAEIYVAKLVALHENAAAYVPDRISHLTALVEQISADPQFYRGEDAVEQLQTGIESLESYGASNPSQA
jgi:hypothetical protein